MIVRYSNKTIAFVVALFALTALVVPLVATPVANQVLAQTAPQGRTIDCSPNTATNPTGTQHVVTCVVRDAAGQPVAGEGVTFTESGPGTISPTQTTTDQNGQARTTATSTEAGTQTIVGRLTDDLEGAEPGEVDECDRAANDPQGAPLGECADTVSKTWTTAAAPQGRTIDCSPNTATNPTGTQHVVTCLVRDAAGQPVQGEAVTFTSSGPGTITPTQTTTDQNGQARTTATSTAAGTQTIVGRLTDDIQGNEPTEVDECDRAANDPQGAPQGECADTVTKTWTTTPAPRGRTINCSPDSATNPTGTQHVVTCVVRDAAGQPVQGERVTFTDGGPGTISPTLTTTDQNGQARTTATSSQAVTQTITGTLTADTEGEEGGEGAVDECDRAANDPQGAPQGQCADTVTKTWTGSGGPTGGACAGYPFGSRTAKPDGSGSVIVGTNGSDVLIGTDGDDTICGLGGDDLIDGEGGNDQVAGGGGHDEIDGGSGRDQLSGNTGNDIIAGRGDNDVISGGGGNDSVKGNAGFDTMRGGNGEDTLQGGTGEDTLAGGDGHDTLRGWTQNDTLLGGYGNDDLYGHRGFDVCRGGPGRDTARGCESG